MSARTTTSNQTDRVVNAIADTCNTCWLKEKYFHARCLNTDVRIYN